MSNELNNIISLNTDGVYEGVAIGGDRCVNVRTVPAKYCSCLYFLDDFACYT